MLTKGNLISLKDHYHHYPPYPYPKAAFLVLSDTQDPFPPSAGAYIKVLDSHGTIINLPYSQLYMYEIIS